MAIFKKTPKPVEDNSFAKINRVKPLTNVLLSLFFTLLAIATVLPVLLVVSISISSSESLAYNGFAFIPSSFDFSAYVGLFKTGSQLIDCYKVTIVTTAVHTVLSVFTMAAFAYVLAQQRFPGKKFYSIYLLIPTIGAYAAPLDETGLSKNSYDPGWQMKAPLLILCAMMLILTFVSSPLNNFLNGFIK